MIVFVRVRCTGGAPQEQAAKFLPRDAL